MSRTRHRRGRNRWPGRGFIRAICQCVTARCVDIGHGTSNISHLLELRQVRTSTAMPCRIARLNYTIFHGLVSPLSNCHLGRVQVITRGHVSNRHILAVSFLFNVSLYSGFRSTLPRGLHRKRNNSPPGEN